MSEPKRWQERLENRDGAKELKKAARLQSLPPDPTIPSRGKTPIRTLPNDILSEVFLEIRRHPWETLWFQVLWVCRRWSMVGRATALLWNGIAIDAKPNVPFVRACL